MFSFGLPAGEPTTAYIGWRAIFNRGYVDILPDRGSENGDKEGVRDLLAWVNAEIKLPPPKGKKRPIKSSIWKQMCERAPRELSQSDEKNLEWVSDDGQMVLRCNPRGSYGYLHICLYKRGESSEAADNE